MRKREILFMVMLLVAIFGIMMSDTGRHGIKKYDCSISEISPDYPIEVKEACRRIRSERIK